MRVRHSLLIVSGILAICVPTIASTLYAAPLVKTDDRPRTSATSLFHPRPNHPRNRLHAALWLRRAADGKTYGRDRLDPLLWRETRHLTHGDSAKRAIARLDDFLSLSDEQLESDDLKRAIMQRDLWAVFDWLAVRSRDLDSANQSGAANSLASRKLRRDLQEKLAAAMRRLALDRTRISRLPDNYAAAIESKRFATEFDPEKPDRPFLPPDLFRDDSPWVRLGAQDGPVAPGHLRGDAGLSRSVFTVYLRLPGGRKATLEYLKRLQGFESPWVRDHSSRASFRLTHNPKTPQFPAGTQAALVRRMMLIDSQGRLQATPIVEQVQIRVYRRIVETKQRDPRPAQRFVEFNLSRERLFAGKNGGLRPVAADEKDFIPSVFAHGYDEIEHHAAMPDRSSSPLTHRMPVTLRTCAGCHREPGVLSFNAYTRLFGPRHTSPPALFDVTSDWSAKMAVIAKQRRYDWGLLAGLFTPTQSVEPVAARKPHHRLRAAVARGLAIVQKGARNYPSHRKCYSCHHQTLPLLAMKHARDAGVRMDEALWRDVLGFTRKSFKGRMDGLKKGTGIGGRAMTVSYGLWTFWLAGEKPDDVTEAMVTFLEKTQETRGRWAPPSHRPPMEESRITTTLLSVYGMQKYGTASQAEAVKAAEGRAQKWLATVKPKSHEDRVMLLWARHLLGGTPAEIAAARKAVLAAQKSDGGWAQLDAMTSDAYATGQTLWVLMQTMSSFAPRTDAGRSNRERTAESALSRSERRQCATAIRKGIDFLLKTQHADGSWFVKTRSRPVQVYFDNGDPHGKSQFISIAATGWATAALAEWLENRRSAVGNRRSED